MQELQGQASGELWRLFEATDNCYMRCQILQVFLKREGLYYKLEGRTVEERLDALVQQAGSDQCWCVYMPSHKLVTSILVVLTSNKLHRIRANHPLRSTRSIETTMLSYY